MTYAQRLNMLMKNMQNGPVWVYIRFRQIGTYFIYIQIRQMLSKVLMFSIKSPELVIEAINIPENRFVIHVPDQRQESANKNTKPGKTQRTSDEH